MCSQVLVPGPSANKQVAKLCSNRTVLALPDPEGMDVWKCEDAHSRIHSFLWERGWQWCQSKPEAGKAVTESRPGRDWWPWITLSHCSLQFTDTRLSILNAKAGAPVPLSSHLDKCQYLTTTTTTTTTMMVTHCNNKTHEAFCAFCLHSAPAPIIGFSSELLRQKIYISTSVCLETGLIELCLSVIIKAHHITKKVNFFLWWGIRTAWWLLEEMESRFWDKCIFSFLFFLQYSPCRVKENLQRFSIVLHCN